MGKFLAMDEKEKATVNRRSSRIVGCGKNGNENQISDKPYKHGGSFDSRRTKEATEKKVRLSGTFYLTDQKVSYIRGEEFGRGTKFGWN